MDMDREKAIKKILSKYRKIFKEIHSDERVFIEKLYTEAAFMEQTLIELQAQVKKEGAVVPLVNGNGFEVLTEHPAQKSYNTMIRNYNGVIKTLIEYIPKESGDELSEWLKK